MSNKLITYLGLRLRSENNLSDFTWAMAKRFKEFFEVFIDLFCFDFDNEVPYEIHREYPLKGYRPDFAIENGDRFFIVESKINDRNYHIVEYSEALETRDLQHSKFGIITNHTISGDERELAIQNEVKLATWEDFVRRLENRLLENKKFPIQVVDYFEAYIRYVKEVCNIVDIEAIRFDNLKSLFYFNHLIAKIIDELRHGVFVCRLYNYSGAFGHGWSGRYFSLWREKQEVSVRPFFGITYEANRPLPGNGKLDIPYICVQFEEEWCREIYTKLKDGKLDQSDFGYFVHDNLIDFYLSQEKFDEFNDASKDNQRQILEAFLGNVLDQIGEHLQ